MARQQLLLNIPQDALCITALAAEVIGAGLLVEATAESTDQGITVSLSNGETVAVLGYTKLGAAAIGDPIDVWLEGIFQVVVDSGSAAIAFGDPLMSAGNGQVTKAATIGIGDYTIGTALHASAAGKQVSFKFVQWLDQVA